MLFHETKKPARLGAVLLGRLGFLDSLHEWDELGIADRSARCSVGPFGPRRHPQVPLLALGRDNGTPRPNVEVSPSGYYAWIERQPSVTEKRREELAAEVRTIHAAVKKRYGSPRMHAELVAQGQACSRNTVTVSEVAGKDFLSARHREQPQDIVESFHDIALRGPRPKRIGVSIKRFGKRVLRQYRGPDLNRRPIAYEATALTAELPRQQWQFTRKPRAGKPGFCRGARHKIPRVAENGLSSAG